MTSRDRMLPLADDNGDLHVQVLDEVAAGVDLDLDGRSGPLSSRPGAPVAGSASVCASKCRDDIMGALALRLWDNHVYLEAMMLMEPECARELHQAGVCESLEPRCLLSAVVEGSTLIIAGTEGKDRISIQQRHARGRIIVQLNDRMKRFDRAAMTAISISALSGRDTIELLSAQPAPVSISGGSGRDFIRGHDASETLSGDGGDDTILAGGGNDRVRGGGGDDFVEGGVGKDNLSGGDGNDRLYGDHGNDRLFGNAGSDTLGGDDEDTLWYAGGPRRSAKAGNDRLDGGDGTDVLLSGVSSASIPEFGIEGIADPAGQDTFTGGAGADILDARGGSITVTEQAGEDLVPFDEAPLAREDVGDTHLHAFLHIIVKTRTGYVEAELPANIGMTPRGFATLHTHSSFDHRIHFEAPGLASFTLADFFEIWGITFSAGNLGRLLSTRRTPITMRVRAPEGDWQDNLEFESYQPRVEDEVIEIYVG